MAKNRSELVSEVAEKTDLTQKQVSDVLDGVFESFSEVVKNGDKLTIPGSRKLERLDENIGAVDVELTPDDLGEIDNAMSQIKVVGDRY